MKKYGGSGGIFLPFLKTRSYLQDQFPPHKKHTASPVTEQSVDDLWSEPTSDVTQAGCGPTTKWPLKHRFLIHLSFPPFLLAVTALYSLFIQRGTERSSSMHPPCIGFQHPHPSHFKPEGGGSIFCRNFVAKNSGEWGCGVSGRWASGLVFQWAKL
jgi:hypothetical protein